MKDPIQGTLDAVREVEIGVSQFRALLSEAAAAKEEAEAGAEALRAELQQSRLLSARVQAEAFECRKEMERLRADYENGMRRDVEVSRQLEQFRTRRRELEATHAAIWGLGCALTGAYADAKSARHTRNRLRRSNDRVREVLGAKPGESPIEAAEVMCREIERLRAERDKERADWSRLLQDERSTLHNTIVGLRSELDIAHRELKRTQLLQSAAETGRGVAESEAKKLRELAGKERVVIDQLDREIRSLRVTIDSSKEALACQLQRFNRAEAERDAALARVAELERAIDLEWSPYVRRAVDVKS